MLAKTVGIKPITLWRYKDLEAAAETNFIYGDLSVMLGNRFDHEVALVSGGCFDKLAKAITTSLNPDEKDMYMALDAAEGAVEIAAWLRRALPFPDDISEYGATRTSALLALRRLLKESNSGHALLVTPVNVVNVIQHHEAAKLVVGANTGGVVALNMVIELLRLALNTSITTVALGQLATGMAALGDLLPSLRSDRMAALPPSDRLAFVAKEVQLWRQSERTSSRSGGAALRSAAPPRPTQRRRSWGPWDIPPCTRPTFGVCWPATPTRRPRRRTPSSRRSTMSTTTRPSPSSSAPACYRCSTRS